MTQQGEPRSSFDDSPVDLVIEGAPESGLGVDPVPWIGLAALTPFLSAFGFELGRRLGASLADRGGGSDLWEEDGPQADLVVESPEHATVFEVRGDFSDEAKLALLDLDFTDKVRGRRWRWDDDERRWRWRVVGQAN